MRYSGAEVMRPRWGWVLFFDCHVAFEVLLILFIRLGYEVNEFIIFYIKGEIVVVVIWLSRTLLGCGERTSEKKK